MRAKLTRRTVVIELEIFTVESVKVDSDRQRWITPDRATVAIIDGDIDSIEVSGEVVNDWGLNRARGRWSGQGLAGSDVPKLIDMIHTEALELNWLAEEQDRQEATAYVVGSP